MQDNISIRVLKHCPILGRRCYFITLKIPTNNLLNLMMKQYIKMPQIFKHTGMQRAFPIYLYKKRY